MLRKTIAGGTLAGVMAFAAPALAADMPMPSYTPPPAAVVPLMYDWSGFYVGLHGGYGWGDLSGTSIPSGPFSFSTDGLLGGLQAGANWQVDNFVFGVEGDIAWTDMDGGVNTALAGPVTGSVDWLSTIRARAGLAFDRVMVYGTGGAAFGRIDVSVPSFAGSESRTHSGWTIGAGVETALTDNLSFKAEYLYVDLGSKSRNVGGVPVSVSHDSSIVRAGLNFRFGL